MHQEVPFHPFPCGVLVSIAFLFPLCVSLASLQSPSNWTLASSQPRNEEAAVPLKQLPPAGLLSRFITNRLRRWGRGIQCSDWPPLRPAPPGIPGAVRPPRC